MILETTDAPESSATPYSLSPGQEFLGRLDLQGHDWIAVQLQAGHTYSFGAVGVGPKHTGVTDPELLLRGPLGGVVRVNDDGGPGTSAAITYTATKTATYFVDVHMLAGTSNGLYGLSFTEGDRVSYGVELGAAELYRSGASWASAPAKAVSLTYGFRETGPARDANGDAAPFHQTTTAQMAAVERALANYSDVGNLTFTRINPTGYTNLGTIRIGDYTSDTDGAGAFANFPGSKADTAQAGDLWLNTTSVSGKSLPPGSYSAYAVLHELGHAMGLDHPGDYNAAPGVDITYANNAQFAQDSAQYSVMSYFDATDTEPDAPNIYAQTLMMYDIYAIQQLYGVNTATRAGNTVYGFHSNAGSVYAFGVNKTPLLCIWDGGGADRLDLSGFTLTQRIDLRDGHFSDIGGFRNNVSIALSCVIENAVGGTGADEITGNDANNRLKGGAGADTLTGGAGNDVLFGQGGADVFVFSAGSGADKVADFDATDTLQLDASLWGEVVKTASEVVDEFAHILNGHVVLEFGADRIALMTVATTLGLADHILIG